MIDGTWECHDFLSNWHIITIILEYIFSTRNIIVRLKGLTVDNVTESIIRYARNFECIYKEFLILYAKL